MNHLEPPAREPVTMVERVAFAICANDIMGREGFLSDDELEGAKIIYRSFNERCLNSHDQKNAAAWLKVPEAAYQRYVLSFKWLLESEDAMREPEGIHIARAKLVRRGWPEYLNAAQAALSVMAELPAVTKLIAEEQGTTPK